jgi:SAM-dependent methyltransferase
MNDIKIISKPESVPFPSYWYELGNEKHFWFQWRLKILQYVIALQNIPLHEPLRILDIGCGHGVLGCQLESRSKWIIDGADLDEAALRQNQKKRGQNMLYNIHDRIAEFKGMYDCVFLLDILEHIVQTDVFVSSALFHLKPGGWLFINVPAINLLYSQYDRVAGHIRRYNKKMLSNILKDQPVSLKDMRYWGLSMIPILFLRKTLISKTFSEKQALKTGFQPITNGVHSILKFVMRLETKALKTPVLGTSLLALAKKE